MFIPTPEQIKDWIESNFDHYRVRKNGDEYLIPNPFYHNDKLKMNVSTSKGIVHDWRGDEWARGKAPTFLWFVQRYNNCGFQDAIKDVCGNGADIKKIMGKLQKDKDSRVNEEAEHARQVKLVLPSAAKKLTGDNCKLAKMVESYLESRGITPQLIEQYDIYYSAGSVIWPYYEYGELVYYQSRDIVSKRFQFPANTDKSEFLYGFDYAEPSFKYVAITESIIDAMTLGKQCLAIGGATLSKTQIRKLRVLNPSSIILAFDNDSAGTQCTIDCYKKLSPYFKLYNAVPPHNYGGINIKDWNDIGKEFGLEAARTVFGDVTTKLDISNFAKLL